MTWPRVAVVGAGAVGCYYGGMLARAGAPVTLIGRPAHVSAIERDGLLLETLAFTERVAVGASTEAEAARGARLVLFCVKSTDKPVRGAVSHWRSSSRPARLPSPLSTRRRPVTAAARR
jgi:2-dehydropantoate 2-reductase